MAFLKYLYGLLIFFSVPCSALTVQELFDPEIPHSFFADNNQENYLLCFYENLRKFITQDDGVQQTFPALYAYDRHEKLALNLPENDCLIFRLISKLFSYYQAAIDDNNSFKLRWCNYKIGSHCPFAPKRDRMILLLSIINKLCVEKNMLLHKDKIVFTSLGSGSLLFEFFLAISLAELNYKNVVMNFIDVCYENKETLQNCRENFLIPLKEYIRKQSERHSYNYSTNWYYDAYDYIKNVLTHSTEKSDIILGIDYAGEGNASTNRPNIFHNCLVLPNTGISFFTPQGLVDSLYLTKPSDSHAKNIFAKIIAHEERNIPLLHDVIDKYQSYQEKIVSSCQKEFSDSDIHSTQFAFKTFQDLIDYTTNSNAIVYQLHRIITPSTSLDQYVQECYQATVKENIKFTIQFMQLMETISEALEKIRNIFLPAM